MKKIIAEIKAKCSDPDKIKDILLSNAATFKGIDHQIDTYFKVNNGRLKLREGQIENTLIHYQRENIAGPKKSEVLLYKPGLNASLKEVLIAANEILVIVDKKRGIYFIDNVKFHIDQVQQLGSFIEIEAIGESDYQSLWTQCEHYINLFGIQEEDLIDCSYSDLLMSVQNA